jgi:hypothetical protein
MHGNAHYDYSAAHDHPSADANVPGRADLEREPLRVCSLWSGNIPASRAFLVIF